MKAWKMIKRNMNLGLLMIILIVAERAASSCSIFGIYQPKLED
jgi:cyclic lactone autoinducer peptide